MAREIGTPSSGPNDYDMRTANMVELYLVETGGSEFLVLSACFSDWKTLVFERCYRPDHWVMRREIVGCIDPQRAVLGHVLLVNKPFDPVADLKKRMDILTKSNWKLQNENSELKEQLRVLRMKGER